MVDGEAALALGELVRRRWQSAACETPPPASPSGDPWPQGFEPHFTDNRIGIARTLPLHDDQTEVREVERLFLRSIAAAQRQIYAENQFVTAESIRSEEHTSELQSLMRISYAVFCLKK